jgi:type II secretory ATPase GspE/PulE/Tfp pilus assembly ATPase PilB-like protein
MFRFLSSLFAKTSEKQLDSTQPPPSLENLREMVDEQPAVRVANLILLQAVTDGASEIILEPGPESSTVFYRVGDELREIMSPPARVHKPVIAHWASMVGVSLVSDLISRPGQVDLTLEGRECSLVLSLESTDSGYKALIKLSLA